jgi:hypothetical protein
MVDLVTNYGAVADAQYYTNAILSITAGTKNLACTTAIWAAGNVGKQIRVGGAGGAGGGTLLTIIDAVAGDGKSITLRDNAVVTLPDATLTMNEDKFVAWGTDNVFAMDAFNTANAGASGVVLTIPAGKFLFGSRAGATSVVVGAGIRSMTLTGAGATTFLIGSISYGAEGGIQPFGDTSARVTTVIAGSTSATLMTTAHASRFTPPCWCCLASVDLQGGGGYPPNNAFWDYLKVTAVNGGTGLLTFDRAASLTHKDNLPMYEPGTGVKASPGAPHNCAAGGPATLYVMNPDWDIEAVFQQYTMVTDPNRSPNANGRMITFKNVSGPNAGPQGSIQMQFKKINCSFPNFSAEVDKQIDSTEITGCTFDYVFMQSASPRNLVMTGSTLTRGFQGGGINTRTSGNTFNGPVSVGVSGFGASNSWISTNDKVPSIIFGGCQIPDLTIYPTFGGGVIKYPIHSEPARWAFPGAWVFFTGANNNNGMPFKVDRIETDGDALYDALTIGSGSAVLQSATAHWSSADIGKPIKVNGAGSAGGSLVTTIAGYTSPTQITLGAAATTPLSASTQYVCWGSALIYVPGLNPNWTNLPATGGGLRGLQGAPVNWVSFTSTDALSGLDAKDLAQAGARNRPLYSYSKRIYNQASWGSGATGAQPTFNFWGAFTQININVTTAYAGSQANCFLTALARGIRVIQTDGTDLPWSFTIDLKQAGVRTITPGAVSKQSNDTIATMAYGWFPGSLAPYLETNISSGTTVWPVVEIELIADQGIPLSRAFSLNLT